MANWRWAFFVCGALGLVWLIFWLKFYSTPSNSKFIRQDEREFIKSTLYKEGEDEGTQKNNISWVDLFRYCKVWGLLLIKFLTDAGWFFFIFWLPKYLNDIRGLDIKGVGAYAWIPYAAAGLGSF